MVTGELRSQIDAVWNAFWAGGIANPLEVIEQITYLLFIRGLDEAHTREENKANRLTRPMERRIFPKGKDGIGKDGGIAYEEMRWSRLQNRDPATMFKIVSEHVFPFLRGMADDNTAHATHMKGARFTIPTPALLAKVVDLLAKIPMEDRDTKGDLYEYMLAKIATGYAGFDALYEPDRKPGPITQAGCWAQARRKFFELADVAAKARSKRTAALSPMAMAAVQKIDAIFVAERAINGRSAEARLAARREDIAPLVNDLIDWMTKERAKLSRHNEFAKGMDYMLKRIDVFTRLLGDGRICLSSNAAERELRGIALGRKSWPFAGSDRGGERAAVMLTLIHTAKLNDADPQAWLADVLARIADHAALRLDELLPWNWRKPMPSCAEAA